MKTILILLGVIVIVFILLQTAPVQNFVKDRAVSWLSKKLNTKVEVDKLFIRIPSSVLLEKVYIEDKQKDTLLYTGQLRVKLNMWKLISGEISIQDIYLKEVNANVTRTLPDTAFNFQFIVDAFASKTPSAPSTDTSSLKMNLDHLLLEDIRATFKDTVTGNDMVVSFAQLETNIKTFDPTHNNYAVPLLKLKGLRANIAQRKPLLESEPPEKDIADAQTPPAFNLDVKRVSLEDCYLNYGNDVSALYALLNLGNLNVDAEKLDLGKQRIELSKLQLLGTTAAIRLGKKPAAKIVKKEVKQEAEAIAESGWIFAVQNLDLANNNIKFDDDGSPRTKTGMDYMHLDVKQLTLAASDVWYQTDSIAGKITKGSLQERDFRLNTLRTNFLYTGTQAYLKNLVIETPGTHLERDIAIQYPSIASLSKDIGKLKLNLDIQNGKVLVRDVLTFAPMLSTTPGFTSPNATWYLSGKMRGAVNDLNIDDLKIRGLGNTRADLSGTIKGLPDIKKLQSNLVIRELSSSDKDIISILPKNTLPSNITLPASMQLSGSFAGTYQRMRTDLKLRTSLGSAAVKGTVQYPDDASRLQYDLNLSTQSLDLQRLLKQPDLGKATLHLHAQGHGRKPETMVANIRGVIDSATYKGYTYRAFDIDGSLDNQLFTINAGIQNQPIHFRLNADGSLAGQWPAGKFNLQIDSIKTKELGLTPQNFVYRGNLTGNFASTNPDSLIGKLYITRSILLDSADRYSIDTISLDASVSDTGQALTLNSSLINASMYGRYRLTQAGTIFQRTIDPYFDILPDSVKADSNYDFRIHAVVNNSKQWQMLLPDLKALDSIHLDGHFSGGGGIDALLEIPVLTYGANHISGLRLTADTKNNVLQARGTVDRFSLGSSLNIYNTNIDADIAHNNIDFAINTRNKKNLTNYHLEGLFAMQPGGSYLFSLKPDSLLLNSEPWNVDRNNKIVIDSTNIFADNFNISKGEQRLLIATLRDKPGQPLDVDFSKFRISTLLHFVKPDSAIADGELNGHVTVSDIMKSPKFIGDLTVDNASFNKDTLGNLKLMVSNPEQNNYEADITLTGQGNDLQVKGNYFTNPNADGTFKARLDIRTLQLRTIDGLTMGNLRNSSGTVNGAFDISGTASKPSVSGQLMFDKAKLMPALMNSYINIDQQSIRATPQGVSFRNFTITDSVNNKAVLDGTVFTTDYTKFRFGLTFDADNFQALNTTKKDNKLYFGKLYFDSRLNIKGTDLHPIVDGTVKVNDKTELTVILPQEDPAVQDREGIVRFIDRDSIPLDSLLANTGYDSLNTSTIRNLDVSVNLTVDKNATFNLIVDEANGDLLKVKGEANLSTAIDPSGKISMTGTYELSEGSYDLSVNFLKRKFLIQKGSKITWQGEPTMADVNITALYIANTAPLDLVEKQLTDVTDTKRNMYRQRLPFEVNLMLTGKLMKPDIKFDIKLPEDKNYNVDKSIISEANSRLAELRNESAEMNKQVFALLLLNHFIGDNPFASGNSAMTAEGFARQSVSKLLSEQLNALAANLIAGVDINFDLASSEDYTTGEKRNRTDLNVNFSKKLLNDRLTVTVGSNFALENPNANREATNLAENVALDYKLSNDGRYMLRAYRKNQYEGVLEGYIIETGVGVVITLDYNRFRNIFRSKKERERQRTEREQRRKTAAEKEAAEKNNPAESKPNTQEPGEQ
ncbi:translocation/assembly module TamB [Pseudoflavitalea sp. G-6-1-2]|uniref:translocation/assembly module TamB domain-containing protein n=1 Tax=Pseudoflavitalea sp. G-6-1-2 TaxID=2728841 RepID=UPI00146A97DD|nr:translocation/assembly module TamB domain-containing protein [Pseudoflavitalea sp. G-6-1-2]NML22463.1 translocation/assembly module TamB [Pseudoflavitalea sp. G-6-1-2]